MNSEKILEIYDLITCNGMREMTEERFNQAVKEVFKNIIIIQRYDSTKIIGEPAKRFDELKHKGWEWRSFYNGWLEGRFEILTELTGIETKIDINSNTCPLCGKRKVKIDGGWEHICTQIIEI